LLGDPSKANAKLGWRHKTSFDALVKEMVEADLIAIRTSKLAAIVAVERASIESRGDARQDLRSHG
jgi:hypothetical protein